MKCARCDTYSRSITREQIDRLKEEVLADISDVFGIEPHFGISDQELPDVRYRLDQIRDSEKTKITEIISPNVPQRLLFLQGDRRIWVLNTLTWQHPRNRDIIRIPNARGIYLYDSGSILLHSPKWCRQAMIHEILHSTSIFSRIANNYNNRRGQWIWPTQRPLREGLTETLTGYILNKKYNDCYERWKSNSYDECSISEPNNVKLWCSLCHCLDIRDVSEFYLSQALNLNGPWRRFVDKINETGHAEFEYALNETTSFNVKSFQQRCVDAISGFRDTYESLSECFNFDNIN